MPPILQPAFTGGLVDPDLDVRTETALYSYACQTLENFIVKPGGGIYRRPGMKHVFRQDRPARLIPFQFNREQVYIIIFVEFAFHVVLEDQIVLNGLTPLITNPLKPMGTTPYSATEIFELDFAQSADKIFITHPNHDPSVLVRRFVDVFELRLDEFSPVPYNPVFDPQRSQANIDGTPGTATVRYKYQVITDGGRISKIVDLLIIDGYLQGNWPTGVSVEVSVVINHDLLLFPGETPFKVIYYKERGGIFGFVGQSIVLNPPFSVLFALGAQWNLSGTNSEHYLTDPVVLSLNLVKPLGIMRDTVVSAEGVLGSLADTEWAFGDNDSLGFETLYFKDIGGVLPFPDDLVQFIELLIDNNYDPDFADTPIDLRSEITDTNNRPIAVTLHQQRLWFGGTNNAPQTLLASRIGSFISFERSVTGLAADAMVLPIVSTRINEIRWMESFNNDLMIGTAGSEWRISAPDGAGLFAANIVARHLSGWGSSSVKPVIIGDTILFVEAGGKDIRDFFQAVQPEGFTGAGGNYLTKLVRDLFEDRKVVNMAYQRSPESILWVVLDDGDLIAVTYLKEARIIAWHTHPTDGKVLWAAVIPGNNGDRVYLSLQRECGFTTVRLDDRFNGNDITKAFFTDEFQVFDGSLVGSGFTWTKSGSGTNEYFVEPAVTVDPSLLYFDREPKDKTTIGSLAIGEWGYGDNDTLGFTTVYVRLDGESDPQNNPDDFVSIYATEFSGMDHLNCSIRDSRYTWIANGGSNQFQLKSVPSTDDTFLPELPFVYENGVKMVRGTFPTLALGEYDYFFVGPLPDDTFYFVRLSDEADPNTKPAGFLTASVEDNGGVNQKLTVLADGAPIAEEVTLDFEGTFTLSEPAFRVCAGLNYISKVSPLDLEIPADPRRGSSGSLGLTKSINSCRIKLRDTVGGKIGASEDRLNDLEFDTPQFDTAIQPFSGYTRQQIRSGNNKTIRIIVVQDQPLPMTITALIPDINIKDSGL